MKNKWTLIHLEDWLYEWELDNWLKVVYKPDRSDRWDYVIAWRAMVWEKEFLVYEKINPNNNQTYWSWTVQTWSQWISFYKNTDLKKNTNYAAILNTKVEEVIPFNWVEWVF